MRKILSTILSSILISVSTTSVVSCKNDNISYGDHKDIIINDFPTNKDLNDISFNKDNNSINQNYDGYISTTTSIYKLKYNKKADFQNLYTPNMYYSKTGNLSIKDVLTFDNRIFLFQADSQQKIKKVLVTSINNNQPNFEDISQDWSQVIYYQQIENYLLMEVQLSKNDNYEMVLYNDNDKTLKQYSVTNKDFALGVDTIPNDKTQNQAILYNGHIYFILNRATPSDATSNIYEISIQSSNTMTIKPYKYSEEFEKYALKSIYYVKGNNGQFGEIILLPKNSVINPYYFILKNKKINFNTKYRLNDAPGQMSFQLWDIKNIKTIANNVFIFTKEHGIIKLDITYTVDDRQKGEYVPMYNFIRYNNNDINDVNLFISDIHSRILWIVQYINDLTYVYQILNPSKIDTQGEVMQLSLTSRNDYKPSIMQVTKSNECLIYYKKQGLYLYN